MAMNGISSSSRAQATGRAGDVHLGGRASNPPQCCRSIIACLARMQPRQLEDGDPTSILAAPSTRRWDAPLGCATGMR